MGLWERLGDRLFGRLIDLRVQNAVKVVDDVYWRELQRVKSVDVPAWDFGKAQASYVDLWRRHPLARRVVELVADYVVGDGLVVSSAHPGVDAWVRRFWNHPQNRMDGRLGAMTEELGRAGELFVLLSRNPGDGMSYCRLVPASWIDEVETDSEDLERELRYHQVGSAPGDAGRWWPAAAVAGREVDQVMLHFAVNRPAGGVRGESDLGPVLKWLDYYEDWLEDRVRVNRVKSAFVWHVKIAGATPAQILQRKAELGRPPAAGSVIVSNEGEEWEAKQPNIDAERVEADGKALRLMIAAGVGVPLHFLSEGESATRATAAEMGDPTFRHLRRRQEELKAVVLSVVSVAYSRAVAAGRARPLSDLGLRVEAPELVRADNESLGRAMRMTVEALARMRECGWVDDATAARLAYKAAGESLTARQVDDILAAVEEVDGGRDTVLEV